MLRLEKLQFNMIGVNTYLIVTGDRCVVIDPGCFSAEEQQKLSDAFESLKVEPKSVLLTHLHFDHVWGVAYLQRKYGVKVYASERELREFGVGDDMLRDWGLPAVEKFEITDNLNGGEELSSEMLIGCEDDELRIKVLSTPGHSADGFSFYLQQQNSVFSGDALFRNSYGRTDLPGGNMDVLMQSLGEVLMSLPKDTKVFAGHGGPTTINDEYKFYL